MLQIANRVSCEVVSGLEFRVPQGFYFKERTIYHDKWLRVLHQIISFCVWLGFKSLFLEEKNEMVNLNSMPQEMFK